MRALLQSARRVLIGGHRGCACSAPENSLDAMQEGLRRGADYLEIDVQLTRDGIPVIYHDTRLEARTALTGYVHEHSLAQLRGAVNGLCTLEEALAWGRGANAHFALELKTVPMDTQPSNLLLAKKLPAALRRATMADNVFVFGQDYQVLRRLRAADADVMLGLIVPFVPADPVQLMRAMGAEVYLSYIYNMTPGVIGALQQAGFYVSGAILRDEGWAKRAIALGVNMFETDNPEKYAAGR